MDNSKVINRVMARVINLVTKEANKGKETVRATKGISKVRMVILVVMDHRMASRVISKVTLVVKVVRSLDSKDKEDSNLVTKGINKDKMVNKLDNKLDNKAISLDKVLVDKGNKVKEISNRVNNRVVDKVHNKTKVDSKVSSSLKTNRVKDKDKGK